MFRNFYISAGARGLVWPGGGGLWVVVMSLAEKLSRNANGERPRRTTMEFGLQPKTGHTGPPHVLDGISLPTPQSSWKYAL